MSANPWEHWQSFAALFATPEPASQSTPLMGSAERFMNAARAFLDSAATASSGGAAAHARAFSDSVRDLFADFPQPWNLGFGGNPLSGRAPSGSMAQFPALGAAREHQERWQRIADAWRRMDDAQRRLQRLWSDAMREAAEAFAVKLANSPPRAASAQDLHKLYDTWIDCAEEAYSRMAHTEAFCDALAECANAGSEWRNNMQASAEHSAKFLDLPTRSEVNSLTTRVHALESELRMLRNATTTQETAAKSRRSPRKPKS